jgi:hypothetical protein
MESGAADQDREPGQRKRTSFERVGGMSAKSAKSAKKPGAAGRYSDNKSLCELDGECDM